MALSSWTDRFAARTRRLGSKRKIAFVLSGGGNLGAVQVGMLRALVEADIKPDLIVGCSVGAINGAAFAAEPTIRGINRLERIWSRMAAGNPDIMPRGLLPLAVQIARKGTSIHESTALEELLLDELIATSFDQLVVPFSCVATDLDSSAEAWFDSGELVPALLASAALPAIFPPVTIDDRRYSDGGVVSELPVAHAVELGATDLYILQVGHLSSRKLDIKRPIDALVHAYWTARLDRFRDDLAAVDTHDSVFRLPAGSSPRLRFDDFSRGPELSERAYVASKHFLETGETLEPIPGPTSDDPDDLDFGHHLVD